MNLFQWFVYDFTLVVMYTYHACHCVYLIFSSMNWSEAKIFCGHLCKGYPSDLRVLPLTIPDTSQISLVFIQCSNWICLFTLRKPKIYIHFFASNANIKVVFTFACGIAWQLEQICLWKRCTIFWSINLKIRRKKNT